MAYFDETMPRPAVIRLSPAPRLTGRLGLSRPPAYSGASPMRAEAAM